MAFTRKWGKNSSPFTSSSALPLYTSFDIVLSKKSLKAVKSIGWAFSFIGGIWPSLSGVRGAIALYREFLPKDKSLNVDVKGAFTIPNIWLFIRKEYIKDKEKPNSVICFLNSKYSGRVKVSARLFSKSKYIYGSMGLFWVGIKNLFSVISAICKSFFIAARNNSVKRLSFILPTTSIFSGSSVRSLKSALPFSARNSTPSNPCIITTTPLPLPCGISVLKKSVIMFSNPPDTYNISFLPSEVSFTAFAALNCVRE